MAMLSTPRHECEKCRKRVSKAAFQSKVPPDGWQLMHSIVFGDQKPSVEELDAFLRNIQTMPEPFGLPTRRTVGAFDEPLPVFLCNECLETFSNFQYIERQIAESPGCPYSADEIRQLVPYVLRFRTEDDAVSAQTVSEPRTREASSALFSAIRQLHRCVSRCLREAQLADILRLCEAGENVCAVNETGRTALQSLIELNDFDLHAAIGINYGDERDMTRHAFWPSGVFHDVLDIEKAARILIAFGADIDAVLPDAQCTLLTYLAAYRSPTPDYLEGGNPYSCAIALLLKLGSNASLQNSEGLSANDLADESITYVLSYWQDLKGADSG